MEPTVRPFYVPLLHVHPRKPQLYSLRILLLAWPCALDRPTAAENYFRKRLCNSTTINKNNRKMCELLHFYRIFLFFLSFFLSFFFFFLINCYLGQEKLFSRIRFWNANYLNEGGKKEEENFSKCNLKGFPVNPMKKVYLWKWVLYKSRDALYRRFIIIIRL